MAISAAIRLLDAEPEIGQFMSEAERAEARNVTLPVTRLAKGQVDIGAVLEEADAFGAIVLEGMLFQRMRIGEQVGHRLLGPDDVLSLTRQARSMLFSHTDCRVVAPVRMALLGRELLVAVRRWPGLLAGLHVRVAEQSDRLAAQLVICQLPRVDQRLLAIMWLLAESWGQVTPVGTSLPLHLTHDVLGGLVGARRSTVTLALGELADQGSVIRQDRGWLLIGGPPVSSLPLAATEEPRVLEPTATIWESSGADEELADADGTGAELLATVRRLRAEHLHNRELVRTQLERLRSSRERVIKGRTRASRVNRPAAPS